MQNNIFKKTFDNTKKQLAQLQKKMGRLKANSAEEGARSLKDSLPKTHKGEEKVVVEISPASMAKSTAVVLLLIILFYFLYQINGILILFFLAFVFSAALHPMVSYLQHRKVPRSIGVFLIYFLVFLIFGILISHLVPLIATQVVDMAHAVGQFVQDLGSGNANFPFSEQLKPYISQLYQTVDLKEAASQIQAALQVIGSQLLNISFGLINVLLVLILTFFMTVEEKSMEKFYLSLFPARYGVYISTRLEAVKEKIGFWVRGQLLLCIAGAILTYIGLLILNVQYALTLSVIAGVLMVIPVVGRVFAWALAMPIVLNQSPVLALWVSIYYFILQQIEVNILSPFIMNKAIGLSPIIIIFAMLVGAQYLGILGLIISIPLATIIAIFVKDYLEKSK